MERIPFSFAKPNLTGKYYTRNRKSNRGDWRLPRMSSPFFPRKLLPEGQRLMSSDNY